MIVSLLVLLIALLLALQLQRSWSVGTRLLNVLLRWENDAGSGLRDLDKAQERRHDELINELHSGRPLPVAVVVRGKETPLEPLIAFPVSADKPVSRNKPKTTTPRRTVWLCKEQRIERGQTVFYQLRATRPVDIRSITLEGPPDAVIVGISLNGCNVGAVCARELHGIEGWVVDPAIAMEVHVARREAQP